MRCFTVLGPSQAGKTTLAKALSEMEGRPAVAELSEALTVRRFTYLEEDWAALDIAGGTEFLGNAGQALAASDAAVLCVPPDPDAAVLAAPYIRLIEAADVPCVVFINKMDANEARLRDIVAALQGYATHALTLRQVPIREDGHVVGAVDLISERAWAYQEGAHSALVEIPDNLHEREQEARTELLEHLADFDDALLEQLIEDRVPPCDKVYDLVAQVHRTNKIVPAFLGAAGHGHGLTRLMKSLRHEIPGAQDTAARLGLGAELLAVGVFSDNRRHVGKSTLLRGFGTAVQHAAPLAGHPLGSLSTLDGKPFSGALPPGELAIAVKSDHLEAGFAYTDQSCRSLPEWSRGNPPALRRLLSPVNDRDDARLSTALARLEACDPGLALEQDAATGHNVILLQGPMHLRRLLARLETEFGIEATAAPVGGIYRETITRPVSHQYRHRKQSGGAGQFADVSLTLKPQPRGAGFAFDETVKGGAVPRNFIPSVGAGAEDAMAKGPLGFPVIDVAVTLTDGKHHAVDSSDHAFRTAAQTCVREALKQGRPTLLQPILRVDVHLPTVYSGALVAQVGTLKGQVQGFDPHPDCRGWDVFHALIPAAVLEDLLQALGGLAHGTAWVETTFDHYEEVHGKEAERVLAEA
ncbi:elongation factor G [Rhodovulum imhoffii]|uniref:Elongation factor G n=1 Tax=Rhodovulum imhoffii TaxID=365340 RepID=A0A2T5BNW6_9RHOB|nr:elongation factor G [Rhodovulum imhoffii]MBK5932550.1 elongation factor G [Rhodovulum imhoffii]PTN00691.1 elongation factor G [Rhodovulum imhoffii]